MAEREPFPPINFAALADALLAQAHTLVPMWLPGGTLRGAEYACGSVQGGAGSSCSVNLTSGKWGDFAADERGNDLVSLYAACFGLPMGKAAVQVARELGLEDVAGVQPERSGANAPAQAPRPIPISAPPASPPPPKADAEGWKTMLPVPPTAPPPNFWHYHRNNDQHQDPIDHTAEYRIDGQLLGFVVRFLDSKGGKETLPYTFNISDRDGSCKWVWRTWDEPRPLYIPAQTMPAGRTVVLVEGEKKAGVLQTLLEAATPGVYLVVSWPGGCKAWKKAMWVWLQGCAVLLWPDCDSKRVPLTKTERETCSDDELAKAVMLQAKPLLPAHKQPGMAAMLGIGALLAAEHSCTVQLLPIPEPGVMVDGWDCADAINTDGWDAERVLAFFAQAGALPTPEGAVAAASGSGGGGGKKIDGPAGAGDGDDAKNKQLPWWLDPYWDDSKKRWLTSRKMVIAALKHDEALQGLLGLNLLSNNIEARFVPPWPHGKAGPITGSFDLLLGDYFSRTYGLPSIPRAALIEAVETVAQTNPYHPVRDYLKGLTHDGTARLDKWLVYALGETPEKLAPAVFEYLCLVGRFWLMGMVYRVMEPGCKFDYCPVLEGAGGLGKSTLAEFLPSTAFYSDTHFDVARGKDAQEQVQGIWGYELAELSGFGKAELELIKAFITAKVDRYRPSYGKVVEAFARQCVMVGTTNLKKYLKDRTGNRRFWPVPVRNRINLSWVLRTRDQLFAEAYALYLQGEAYTPSYLVEERLFAPMQESRLVDTAVTSELLRVLTRSPGVSGPSTTVNDLTSFATLSELTMALGVDAAKSNPALEAQIRSWMEHQGWASVKKQINGVRAWGFARPKKWPPEDIDVAEWQPPEEPELPTAAASATNHTSADADSLSPAAKYLKDADDAPF